MNSICTCKTVANKSDKLLKCTNVDCPDEMFFCLSCLGRKRMPNSNKVWFCPACMVSNAQKPTQQRVQLLSQRPCMSQQHQANCHVCLNKHQANCHMSQQTPSQWSRTSQSTTSQQPRKCQQTPSQQPCMSCQTPSSSQISHNKSRTNRVLELKK